jgi:siroheme synthase-like protein
MSQEGNPLFPVFLKLDEIQTVIVGGGNVGLEKLEALLKNDPSARVNVVAPIIKEEIRSLASKHQYIKLIEEEVTHNHLEEADMAILATDDHELHRSLKDWAKGRHLLMNVADTPDLCDFYLGSTVKKGDLKIGISTNGKSPTFAKRFREILEESLPDETSQLLNRLKGFRDHLKGNFNEKVKKLNELTSTLVDHDK